MISLPRQSTAALLSRRGALPSPQPETGFAVRRGAPAVAEDEFSGLLILAPERVGRSSSLDGNCGIVTACASLNAPAVDGLRDIKKSKDRLSVRHELRLLEFLLKQCCHCRDSLDIVIMGTAPQLPHLG